jgi:hypothetical protein
MTLKLAATELLRIVIEKLLFPVWRTRHYNSALEETSSSLLERCISAQRNGATFPTIWSLILKGHPLVAGLPTNAIREGRTVLEVPLISGRRLVCESASDESFSLD